MRVVLRASACPIDCPPPSFNNSIRKDRFVDQATCRSRIDSSTKDRSFEQHMDGAPEGGAPIAVLLNMRILFLRNAKPADQEGDTQPQGTCAPENENNPRQDGIKLLLCMLLFFLSTSVGEVTHAIAAVVGQGAVILHPSYFVCGCKGMCRPRNTTCICIRVCTCRQEWARIRRALTCTRLLQQATHSSLASLLASDAALESLLLRHAAAL